MRKAFSCEDFPQLGLNVTFMKNSKIEWTHHTFNPWWGCTKVSDACAHCYAETFTKRTGHDVWGPDKPRRFFGDKHWEAPLLWNDQAKKAGERQRVFCASMADVFEDYDGPKKLELLNARSQLWRLIEQTPNLDWLLLTKRPENILRFLPQDRDQTSRLWFGTTVENQEQANKRIPELLKVPARIRFLSCEPLLEAVDLMRWLPIAETWPCKITTEGLVEQTGPKSFIPKESPIANRPSPIHWIICGGESGPGARPMHPDWGRSLRDQCHDADVPFFFKQWGDWLPEKQGAAYLDGYHEARVLTPAPGLVYRVGKAKAGRLLDGKEWNEVPQ
jgi:protein gp37